MPIQAKLKIGAPNDKYEQEADCVADQVMRMPDPTIRKNSHVAGRDEVIKSRPAADQITSILQRQETSPDGETIQAKSRSREPPVVPPDIESGINSLRGRGKPLPKSERAFFEPRLGADFSGVRVHNDSNANELARSVNAKAFTIGKEVVFGRGYYSSGSDEGARLLGHELAHVMQQNRKGHSLNNALPQPNTLQRQEENESTTAPYNQAIVAQAWERTKKPIGEAYNYLPGWWYSPNPELEKWTTTLNQSQIDENANIPINEGIVDWGDGESGMGALTCNLYVYDVLYAAGCNPPLSSHKHYYDAGQTYKLKKSKLRNFFEVVTSPYLVLPGDIMANGIHLEIVTEIIKKGKKFKALGAHDNGVAGNHYSFKDKKFLRVK